MKDGPLGARMTFVQANPLEYLSNSSDAASRATYDTAILCQSSWYFSSPAELRDTLRTLARVAKRVCIAEFALASSSPRAVPHVLAALTQGALEVRKRVSESNIRTLLSPMQIADLASEAGLRLVEGSARTLATPEGMHDGRWEVGAVLAPDFEKEVKREVTVEKEQVLVLAMLNAVREAKEALPEGIKVGTMDVWAAQFVSA
jgi:hypothetical protein